MDQISLTQQEIARIEEILQSLDAALAGDSEATAWAERRLRPRIDFAHPMWLYLLFDAEQSWIRVYSRNLSTGGLAFLAKRPFAKDSMVVISHHLNEGCDQLALCRVTFCRAVEGIFCEVGLVFEAVVPDPESLRAIPPEWQSQVLRNTWVARSSTPSNH